MAESTNQPNVPAQPSGRETFPLDAPHTLRFASQRTPLGEVTDQAGSQLEVMATFGAIGYQEVIASVVRRPAIHENDSGRWCLLRGTGEDSDPSEALVLDPFGNKPMKLEVEGARVSALYDPRNDELMVGPAAQGDAVNVGYTMTLPMERETGSTRQ